MKRFSAVALVILVGVFVLLGIKWSKVARPGGFNGSVPAVNPGSNASAAHLRSVPMASFQAKDPSVVAGPVASRASSPLPAAADVPVPELPPRTILENVRSAVRLYGSTFGGNPVGTNPEITAALAGNNPKQINFIGADGGLRIDDRGNLIDAWGTPFFFHQISGAETEIRSAGPDRVLWTADDLVAK